MKPTKTDKKTAICFLAASVAHFLLQIILIAFATIYLKDEVNFTTTERSTIFKIVETSYEILLLPMSLAWVKFDPYFSELYIPGMESFQPFLVISNSFVWGIAITGLYTGIRKRFFSSNEVTQSQTESTINREL